MITAAGRIRWGNALRALAVLLAVGVVLLPAVPQPRLHVCRMMGTMLEHCCCMAHHEQGDLAQPVADQAAADASAASAATVPGKRPCCLQIAIDQHQPLALEGLKAAELPIAPVRHVMEVLDLPARHRDRYGGAASAAPYPDGPPSYLRWGAFLT
jgi:hypothetical protein